MADYKIDDTVDITDVVCPVTFVNISLFSSSMKYLSDTRKLIKCIFQTTLLFLPVLSALQSFLLLLHLRNRSLSGLT